MNLKKTGKIIISIILIILIVSSFLVGLTGKIAITLKKWNNNEIQVLCIPSLKTTYKYLKEQIFFIKLKE